jgi:hypothetical protein
MPVQRCFIDTTPSWSRSAPAAMPGYTAPGSCGGGCPTSSSPFGASGIPMRSSSSGFPWKCLLAY